MCARCPAHAMHGLTGQTSVDVCYCEQGYLWDSVAKTCNICPSNTFNNRVNESQCFTCIGGTGGDHTQCPGITQVPAGYQTTTSGANLEPCPANSYNDGTLIKCAQCPSPSTFSSVGALTSVSQCACQPGYARVGGVCTACAVGSYKTEPGDAACTLCGTGATTAATASAQGDACRCVAGFEPAGAACAACAGGSAKYIVGNVSCIACPQHSTLPSAKPHVATSPLPLPALPV